MNGSESEGDWESLLDSGQLDDNIKKLTILARPKPPTQQSPLSGDTRVEVICSEEEARTPSPAMLTTVISVTPATPTNCRVSLHTPEPSSCYSPQSSPCTR